MYVEYRRNKATENLKENTVYFVVVLNRIFRVLIDEIFPSRRFSKENFKQTRERSQRDNLLMESLMCVHISEMFNDPNNFSSKELLPRFKLSPTYRKV